MATSVVRTVVSPRTARAAATARGVDTEQEREAVPVERRNDPGVSKESDRRKLHADRLRSVARDVLLEVTRAAPLQFARNLFDRLHVLVAATVAFTNRDLALELRTITSQCGGDAIVDEHRLVDEAVQRG
jgi:hypothetical protein